jgi:hypothetical protein
VTVLSNVVLIFFISIDLLAQNGSFFSCVSIALSVKKSASLTSRKSCDIKESRQGGLKNGPATPGGRVRVEAKWAAK